MAASGRTSDRRGSKIGVSVPHAPAVAQDTVYSDHENRAGQGGCVLAIAEGHCACSSRCEACQSSAAEESWLEKTILCYIPYLPWVFQAGVAD